MADSRGLGRDHQRRRRDAGPAVDGGLAVYTGLAQHRSQLGNPTVVASGRDIGERKVARAGDVPRHRVERLHLPAVALRHARVDDREAAAADVVGRHRVVVAGTRDEALRGRRSRAQRTGLERPAGGAPGADAAVEHGGVRVAEVAQ